MPKTFPDAHHFPEVGVPMFWPFGLALEAEKDALNFSQRNLDYLEEIEKTQIERKPPEWATPNKVALELHTLKLRDFSRGDGAPVLVLPPYAGHTSVIADFHAGQSLVSTLMDNGCARVISVDWKSATPAMRDYDIDNYLAEINVCVDELGGEVSLVGLCQGGWAAAMYAARFPAKVRRLVLAGSPIDTNAGDGAIKTMAHNTPMRFYESLVQSGDGLLKGGYMLEGFKNMHPAKQYVEKFVDLYEHVEDPSYIERFNTFERWYECTLNLPGAWYLQAVQQLFKENRLAKGTFVGLGRKLDLKDVTCPTYLLAGESDDITPPAQVFAAEHLLGSKDIRKALAKGGHIGLFMGHGVLRDDWPAIARWLAAD
ncbi:alpha/beta fold hydrolase [Phenylobacterium sp.]|uniref:alpha/beta fold hydrolase n=1 Tax=Phenylobacterium sp. TaxID=1871053 RepID=UPI0035ADB5D9